MKNANKEMYGDKEKIENYFKREKYWRTISKKIINQIKKYKRIGKLLDVGCFCGLFLDEARKAGFNVFGVEKEKEAADYAKKRFDLEIVNSEFAKFNDGQFDIITFIDVLEHLPNLKQVLQKVNKIMTKEGVLFIQCPNIDSLVYKVTQEKWNWLLPNVHLHHFSIRSLATILEENGFRVLSVRTYDDISEFAYNLLDILGIKKRNILEKMVWKSLRIFFLSLLQFSFIWSYFGYGGSLNMIAKKNNH